MRILGISAFYHDSAAALVEDGKVIAAAQEERFTRMKHDPSFPSNAVAYCLAEGLARLSDIDHIVFYEKPLPKFERLIETYLSFAPSGFNSFRNSMPLWIREKLFQKNLLEKKLRGIEPGWKGELLFAEHHQSHAAERVLCVSFRTSRGSDDGWCWRMADDIVRRRRRQRTEAAARNQLSALAGSPVFRFHLLHRVQSQLRRIQAYGSGALWAGRSIKTRFTRT